MRESQLAIRFRPSDSVCNPLIPSYKGTFQELSRVDKIFVIQNGYKTDNALIAPSQSVPFRRSNGIRYGQRWNTRNKGPSYSNRHPKHPVVQVDSAISLFVLRTPFNEPHEFYNSFSF